MAMTAAAAQAGPVFPRHLTPVYLACRDHGVSCRIVAPGRDAFDLGGGDPHILLISDDELGRSARGPAGFDKQSLREFIGGAEAVLVSVGVPNQSDYFAASTAAAVLRKHVVIIETRVEQELPWLDFVSKANPAIQIVSSSGTGFGARQ